MRSPTPIYRPRRAAIVIALLIAAGVAYAVHNAPRAPEAPAGTTAPTTAPTAQSDAAAFTRYAASCTGLPASTPADQMLAALQAQGIATAIPTDSGPAIAEAAYQRLANAVFGCALRHGYQPR